MAEHVRALREGMRNDAGPIRVMHVSQPDDGGTATVLEHLAATDLEKGRTVTVVSPPGRLEHWAAAAGAAWISLPLARELQATDFGAIRRLRKLLPSVDIVFLHSSKAGAVGRLALSTLPRSRRPRCVFIPHAWSWYVGGRFATVYRLFERLTASQADVIVVVSPAEERDGRSQLTSTDAEKILLIENGVDTDTYSPDGPRAPRTSDPLIVCVGRLCTQKGQDLLIGALSHLKDQSVTLSFIGDGPELPSLQELAESLGIAERVHFAGHLDPRPSFRAADVVVVPSRWEGLSLVLLEAMACGSTVLATREAAAAFRGKDGIAISSSGETGELARELTELLADPQRRQALGRRARLAVETNYSLHRATAEYDCLVRSLSRANTPRSSRHAVGS